MKVIIKYAKCHRHFFRATKLSKIVLDACDKLNWKVKKDRAEYGVYIEGITVKNVVNKIEYQIRGEYDKNSNKKICFFFFFNYYN